ncbi:adenylyl-sulfate kinase [Nocardioides daphniae]|uniref:Adenylyl-sulfate kinase n=1 Tax=Nocardioides daphniae TaxID=402297 RepID=A0ABQ1PYW7_9ACTN|nr:hypothetical protein GCM10007231_02280 [Nocardioides daphniae]
MSSSLPQHCPSPRELDDLELLLSGALAPRTRFDDPRDADALVTLDLPEELQGRAVELVDPEGMPLARLEADGSLVALTHAQYGPFRRLHLSPAQARSSYPGRSWIPVDDALTTEEIGRLRHRGALVLLALTGAGTPRLSPVALVRATLAAAAELPDAVVVAVPLASHGDPAADARLRERVVAAYAGGDAVWPIPPRAEEPTLTDFPAGVAAVVRRDRPAPAEQGLVLFFTGLSGSGKSTLARALMDRILEQGQRTVTSLDGDVVRRNLSAGLSFSKADRETNIRRIGWVAAEIARHGGLAVCSPIAPFAETRTEVREMVESAGGAFFLVHVATPVEECERRDRKGLYAKARRGEIPEFTGISSPYEAPDDASVVVDTTGRSVEDALDDVIDALAESGLLDVRTSGSRSRVEPFPVAAAPAPAAPSLFADPTPSRRGARAADRLSVIFVCTANVCRSPFMELTAQSIVGDAVEFASIGTDAKVGRSMDAVISEFLPQGVTNGHFRAAAVSEDAVDAADLILTAEASHADHLVERHPRAFRKIFTLAQWAETVQGSDLRGRELIEWAGQYRVPRAPEHDITDPYKRGRERAQVAAQRITSLLQAGIPPLTRD